MRRWRLPKQLSRPRQPRWRVIIAAFILIFTIWKLTTGKGESRLAKKLSWRTQDLDLPPSWEKVRQWEESLPQHDPDLPFPEGRHGRYLYFKNQIEGLGWNNQLNEILMNTWLAYAANRAYVFQDSKWTPQHYPWSKDKAREWPPRTPLNALISGPSAGGPWDPADPAPRAVSPRWYELACPKRDRKIIKTEDVKWPVEHAEGTVVFDTWLKLINDTPERCIEIHPAPPNVDGNPQVFDLWLLGSSRVLSLWEGFKNSPVSRLLAASPVVQSAVDRNDFLFRPRGPRPTIPASNVPYDRMLALHLRRGDYKGACDGFAAWNSTYYSWNLLDTLPDPFPHPSGYTYGKSTPEGYLTYMEHCFPTEEQVMKRIRTARDEYVQNAKKGDYRHLDVLFLLTNDKTEWIEELKKVLKKDGWTTIVTTRDLQLDQEQKEVGMAVDMELARKAAVFIGNGFSSFTSNIVHRRLVDGREPLSIRFF